MEMFTGIFFIAAAIWFIIVGGFFVTTSNFQSMLAFKIVPVALGLASIFLSLHHYGFIIQVG